MQGVKEAFKSRKILNVASSLLQAFVSAVSAIFVSKFSFHFLGAGLLGFWAIILSISSFGAFLNSGICVAVIKFIAESDGKDPYVVRKTIFSSLVISLTLTLLASIFIFIIFIIYFSFQPSYEGHSWYLYALGAIIVFILTSLSNITLNFFDGFKLTYFKNGIIIFTTIIYLSLSYFFLKQFALLGLIVVLIIQNFLIIISGLTILHRRKYFIFSLTYFDKSHAKELLRFSTKVQYITVIGFILDPLTKGLLKYFGSYNNVGVYDMANKLVLQVRLIIVNLNQLLLPYFSKTVEGDGKSNKYIYITIFKLLIRPATWIFISLIIFSKFFSIFWLKQYNPEFVFYIVLLSVASLINVLSTPAYYSSLGQGKLRSLLDVHLLMGLLNLLLGFILGYFVSAKGVAAAWAIALTVGSIVLIYYASKEYNITLMEKAGESLWVLATGLLFAFFPLFFPDYYSKYYTFVLIAYAIWLVAGGYTYFKNIYQSYLHKFK
jgi:O-antigen/teichoic acid export membrane protein